LQIDLNTKILQQKGKNKNKYPAYFSLLKSFAEYFELLSFDIENPTQDQKVYSGEYGERIKKWEKLNLSVKKIKKQFIKLTEVRINLAKENGFSSYKAFIS